MVFIITYTSYGIHKDREIYTTEASALHRFEQLNACPYVSKLKMRENSARALAL